MRLRGENETSSRVKWSKNFHGLFRKPERDSQVAGRGNASAGTRDMLSVKGVLGPKRGGGGIWRTYPVTFYFKQVSRANSSVQGETRAKFHRGWGGAG